jgi:phosphate transport system protein
MYKRKIQLIAGSTYTVSLPKEWVKKNRLKEKNEVSLYEKNDRTLIISPRSLEKSKMNKISLDIDRYADIDQMLFAVYQLGIEDILLFSKKEITKDVRSRIRKVLAHMSSSEISYEDSQKIEIKVLLDKSKVNVAQILYRMGLVAGLSLENISAGAEIDEVRTNEDEMDRLYHLMTKIISVSLIDPDVLESSGIKNVSLIPLYFLVSKKIENIEDNALDLSEHLQANVISEDDKKVLGFIKKELERSITTVTHKPEKIFEMATKDNLRAVCSLISKFGDKIVASYLREMVKYVVDIEEEVAALSFYEELIARNVI